LFIAALIITGLFISKSLKSWNKNFTNTSNSIIFHRN
jgi:hypothetical protein